MESTATRRCATFPQKPDPAHTLAMIFDEWIFAPGAALGF
jgi:hypothetical protein